MIDIELQRTRSAMAESVTLPIATWLEVLDELESLRQVEPVVQEPIPFGLPGSTLGFPKPEPFEQDAFAYQKLEKAEQEPVLFDKWDVDEAKSLLPAMRQGVALLEYVAGVLPKSTEPVKHDHSGEANEMVQEPVAKITDVYPIRIEWLKEATLNSYLYAAPVEPVKQVPLSTNLTGLPTNLAGLHTNQTEQEPVAHELRRNKAEREYFNARPQIDTLDRRNVFRAGFDAFANSGKPIADQEQPSLDDDEAEKRMATPKQEKCECVVKRLIFSGDREYCETCGWPIYTFEEHRARLLEERK